MDSAAERLGWVLERIENAARRSGRKPQEITLVAVTKTVPLDRILPFHKAGVRHFGENRVQEALEKYQNLDGTRRLDGTMHLIGQLQKNKAKKAVGFFDMVQSLDSLALADDLNRHAGALGRTVSCLVEVKISAEETKFGVAPQELDKFLAQLVSRTSLIIKGLMGIAPLSVAAEETRPHFRHLRGLWEKSGLEVLSMGMTSDFEVAIEEGSTMVRLGTALFGPRT